MKKIIILFVLLLMSCEKNPNNIEIKRKNLNLLLERFMSGKAPV